MPTVGQHLVETLERFGVTHVFGVPGDSVDTILEPLRRAGRPAFVQVRHEEAGAFMASAQAKLTGRLAACLGTAGPGAIHLLNGLYDARLDGVPVLAITGQVQSDLIGTDYFQEVNLTRLFDDVALYNQIVSRPDQAAAMIRQAARAAVLGRGVAHLSFPFDVPRQNMPDEDVPRPAAPVPVRPSDDAIDRAAQLVNAAERPVILAGVGCLGANSALLAFARKVSAPIVHTLPAKGIVPDDEPLSMGGLGLLGASPAHRAVEEADLLLLLGSNYPYLQFIPSHVKVVQLDRDPRRLGHRLGVDVPLQGDAALTLPLLLHRVEARDGGAWADSLRRDKKAFDERVARKAASSGRPIRPQFIAGTLSKVIDPDAVVAMDVGNSLVWMARGLKMTRQRFLVSSWLGSMGFGLPAAVAAALTDPGRQAVAVVGDGGFTMLMGDLLTAVKYDLPVKVIVLDNGKLAMIKFEQEIIGYPEFGVDLTNPDFAAYARAAGAHGIRVEDPDDLEEALREAFRTEGPALVDVLTDPDTPPIPPRVTFGQAANYAVALFRETFGG